MILYKIICKGIINIIIQTEKNSQIISSKGQKSGPDKQYSRIRCTVLDKSFRVTTTHNLNNKIGIQNLRKNGLHLINHNNYRNLKNKLSAP